VPAAADTVRLDAPGTYTVTLQGSAAAAQLSVGGPGSTPLLWLQGSRDRGNAVLRVGSGATNTGTIRLESTGAAYGAGLQLNAGALVNQGVIETGIGGGGTRSLSLDLDNRGQLLVGAPTVLAKAAAVYTNSGSVQIAAGQTLTISGAAQSFIQRAGTLEIAGALLFLGNTASLGRSLFTYEGGAIAGSLTVQNAVLALGPGGIGPAGFRMRGRSELRGNVSAGQTVWVNGTTLTSALATWTEGLVNQGTIRLESSEAPEPSLLAIPAGTLTNQEPGRIEIGQGSGGFRRLTAVLQNMGTVAVEASATLNGPDTTAVWTNRGAISVAPTDTLWVSGGILANPDPGVLDGGGLLLLDHSTLTGEGTLRLNLEARASTVSPGETTGRDVRIGTIAIEGTYAQDARSRIDLDLDNRADYDRLTVSGQAGIAGRLRLRPSAGYSPAACDGFAVLAAQRLNGAFQEVQPSSLGSGLQLLLDQGSQSLALLVRDPASLVNLYPTELALGEGGAPQRYRVCLGQTPSSQTVVLPEPDGQVRVESGPLVFAAGTRATVDSLEVVAVDDTLSQGLHQGTIRHRSQSGDPRFDRLSIASVTAQIQDNETLPSLTIDDLALPEGDSGTGQAGFVVRLSRASISEVTATWRTVDATAVAGSDYRAASGTVVFPAGQTATVVAIEVMGDRVSEPDEAFAVELGAATQAMVARTRATATLTNDDPEPTLSVADGAVVEGANGTRSLVFAVALSSPSATPITVAWATADGTALAGSDYLAASGVLAFAPGIISRTIGVTVNGDPLSEPDESLRLQLTGAAGAVIARGEGTGLILNDDPTVLVVGDATVVEGNSGTRILTLPVSLSSPSATPVSVAWTTADQTALAGSDYAAASGRLTLAPGETTATIDVTTWGDLLSEPDETLTVRLSEAANAALRDSIGLGALVNDDPLPSLAIADARVAEGQTGTQALVFTVTLSAPSGQPVAVAWATANRTAISGSDYLAAAGVLNLAPGATTGSVRVQVNGDAANEADETLALTLSNPTGASLVRAQATGTIVNDDGPPSLSLGDAMLSEGNAGTRLMTFTASLSNPSAQTVTVGWFTADSTAAAGSEYVAATGGLTFPPGTTTRPLTVAVLGDLTVEPNETLTVTLRDPVGATIADGHAVGIILNDDVARLSIGDTSIQEGNSSSTHMTFRVTLSNPTLTTTTVVWTTADSTARAGSDYLAAGGSLTFAPGQASQDLTLTVLGDTLSEDNEAIVVRLSGAVNATLADSVGVGTILNDDLSVRLAISDATVVEGNSGTTPLTFFVSLAPVSGRPVTVAWTAASGSAVAAADFVGAGGVLTFAPGETRKSVVIAAIGDSLNEIDETFTVDLSAAVGAAIVDRQGQATLLNDDPLPALSVGDPSLSEGDTGTTALVFPVTLSAPSGQTVTVTSGTVSGTATARSDYAAVSGSLAFSPGQTVVNVAVPVLGDLLNEVDETVFLRLDSPSNATVARVQGIGTIANDDPLPSLSVADVAVDEGSTGTRGMNFTVALSAPSGRTIWVPWATADGTALAGSDYLAASGTLVLAAGQTSRTVTVTVLADAVTEPDETLALGLRTPINAALIRAEGVGTIRNDDLPPALRVGDATALEGSSGPGRITFPITLSHPSSLPVTVSWSTTDGTALNGSDYAATGGTLAFAPGDTVTSLAMVLIDDAILEPLETFTVNLRDPVNAGLARAQAQGAVEDDDSLPRIAVADGAATEGDAGSAALSFALTLSAPSLVPVTVAWSTTDGTAVAGSDFVAASGTATFAPGQTTATVAVTITGDRVNEADEAFLLNLSTPSHAIIADGQGNGTIANDDAVPSLSVDDVSVAEGSSGTQALGFTITLSAASGQTVTVGYATADGTAMADSDFVAARGTATLAPGQTTATVAVTITGDRVNEADETFFLNLSTPGHAIITDGQGSGTITNDDAVPSASVDDASIAEGDGSASLLTFTVSLSNPTTQTVTISYATANGTALAGSDYAAASGTTIFAPGQTSQTLAVTVSGDLVNEADETLSLNLSNPTKASIADGQGIGTISNDDAPPSLSVNDGSVTEANSGTRTLSFTVALDVASGQTVTANYATVDGTATAGSDYVAASGVVTFAAGQTSQTVTVTVNGDLLNEADETFSLSLSSPIHATIGRGQGTGTITNDDALPSLSVNDVAVVEGNSGTTALSFAVTLSAASGQTVSAGYATANGTALAGTDYTAASGTVTIAPGQTSQTVTVMVSGEWVYEPNETLFLNLSNPAHATIADAQAIGTITNDDNAPTLSVKDVSVAEGNSGTSPLTFTVSLSNPSAQTVTVSYATANGTASSSSDYTATNGSLSFAAGETTRSVPVTVKGDTVYEASETLNLNLTSPTNAAIADAQGIGTIINDESQPAFSVNDVSIIEGNASSRNVTFTITLSPPSSQITSVVYATANGTAASGSDYQAVSATTLSFPAGTTTKTVNVKVYGDVTIEASETFYVNLSGPTNAIIGDAQGIGTITNDDLGKLVAGRPDPSAFGVQCYPNPANPTAQIVYVLTEDTSVRLTVYDAVGQQVQLLVDQPQAAGVYHVAWDGRGSSGRRLAAGVYLYQLQAGSRVALGKVTLAP
jgi:hypothetical protein